jgi:hypothetical protein
MSNATLIEPDRARVGLAAPGAAGRTGPEPPAGGTSLPSSAPGWHVDPLDAKVLRFWDGQDWTTWTQPSQVPEPPNGWVRIIDPHWWEPPTDGTADHLASWHLLAQHAQERRGRRVKR